MAKIVAPAAAEPQPSSKPENDISPANSDEEDYSNNEEALFNLAEMSFRTQLLAQYMADERHVYHISIPHRNRLSAMEMDTDNHGVQNLLLTAENIPELKNMICLACGNLPVHLRAYFLWGNAISSASKFSSPNYGLKRRILTADPYKGMGCWKLYHLNKQNRCRRQCWRR